MIALKFNESENVLKIQTEGKISLREAIEMIQQIGKDDSLPRELYMLEFALNADWDVGQEGLPELIRVLKEESTKFSRIRHAVLHLDPVHHAYSSLLNKVFTKGNYTRKILPTEKMARTWLFDGEN